MSTDTFTVSSVCAPTSKLKSALPIRLLRLAGMLTSVVLPLCTYLADALPFESDSMLNFQSILYRLLLKSLALVPLAGATGLPCSSTRSASCHCDLPCISTFSVLKISFSGTLVTVHRSMPLARCTCSTRPFTPLGSFSVRPQLTRLPSRSCMSSGVESMK